LFAVCGFADHVFLNLIAFFRLIPAESTILNHLKSWIAKMMHKICLR